MTAEEHIVAYIESDRDYYTRLLKLECDRKMPAPANTWMRRRQPASLALQALTIVTDCYSDMLRNGSAAFDDIYSARELSNAALALLDWSAPE